MPAYVVARETGSPPEGADEQPGDTWTGALKALRSEIAAASKPVAVGPPMPT
jgi:hypothetical protein